MWQQGDRHGGGFRKHRLTIDFLRGLRQATTHCPCCGVELRYDYQPLADGRRRNQASLDRTDSTRGYEPENVRILCWNCNRLKADMTLEDAERLVNYLRRML